MRRAKHFEVHLTKESKGAFHLKSGVKITARILIWSESEMSGQLRRRSQVHPRDLEKFTIAKIKGETD